MYINVQTSEYPISETQIRSANINISYPFPFVPSYPYEWVFRTPQPAFDPITMRVEEDVPEYTSKNVYEQRWKIINLDAETIQANQIAATLQLQKQIEEAMDNLFDETAKQKRYNNRWTCATRAGYAGPFQAECLAFATWMDSCNQLAYVLQGEIMRGERPMFATVEEALAVLPEMVWPS